ncbi:MAG: DUF1508 domain-containing protein [Clostridia bacterium]|nr:DUF1508 domain-containing protein [Clostridia bacterium]
MYLENLNAMKPILWILIIAAAAIVLIVVITLLTKRKKKSGGMSAAEQREIEANMQAIKEEQEKEAAKRNLKEKVEAQRQAAIRKEVFDRLEAQRLEAEGEEAVKEETAVTEEKTEEKVEEKPATKKATAKKAPAKKAAAKKEETVEEKTEEKAEEKPAPKKATAKKAPAKKEAKVEEKVEEKPAPKKATAKKAPAKKETKVEEKAVEKVEEKPVLTDDSDTDTLARYAGKWAVYHILTDDNSEDDMYFFELHASNGEKLLASEEYTSYQGAVRGIETHKTNILKGNFKITLSKKGDYIVKLLSGSGQLLCTGENYASKVRCESAIKSIKRFARTAVVDENVQDYFLKVPKEEDNYVAPIADGVNGKWIISNREDTDGEKVFFFELFANNGEKLLSSEEYTTYAGAVNGIQTHKQNIAKGNFRITLTKKGDYIYKILNGNGQLLCLGEHYKSKVRCQSAVESVKRFAENSPVLTDSEQVKD